MSDEEHEVILVLAPVRWGEVTDPYDIIICVGCGEACWLSRPAQLCLDENPEGEVICAACYIRDVDTDGSPEKVLDVNSGEHLHPGLRQAIEDFARRRMMQDDGGPR